jgi:cell division septation protein DedD
MDELTKYRLTGAIVWLGMLILIVPSWYGDPVDYVKDQSLFSIESVTGTVPVDSMPVKPAVQNTHRPSLDVPNLPSVSSAATVSLSVPDKSVESVEPIEPIGQWVVRLASYSNIQSANRMVDQLGSRYQATIGDFSTSDRRIYSVRIGPFDRLNTALEAKKELDAEFNIDALVVKIR